MSTVHTKGTVVIHTERCKGCELCIPVCKPQVLQMSTSTNTQGMRYPELLAGCTGCTACALVCPDFCFEIYRYEQPLELESEESEQ